jgi:3-methyl-2-oxobutanoate hydroxymethyltransferase
MKSRTVPGVMASKRRNGSDPIVMVTAYDAPSARVATEADVDMILVGDSLAMVVLGYEDTLDLTIDDMAHHTRAVMRAKPTAVVVTDMPWMSYHVSAEESVRNAAELIRAGAQSVKVEGGRKRIPFIEAILNAEIPVQAHIGLTPQSTNVMGGFRVQGKEASAAEGLIEDARALQEVGCYSIVVEGVPSIVGKLITEAVDIPTIGIGAGPDTDGQVLVYHDLIGLENRFKPKFVRRFGDAFAQQSEAVAAYAAAVRTAAFPSLEEVYSGDESLETIGLYGASGGEAQSGEA